MPEPLLGTAEPGGVPGAAREAVPEEAPRRRLTGRQAATVGSLVEAAVAELREHGYDGLTVRNVARRAGVAPATAYTYFGSKDHLVTEVFWRRLRALPDPAPGPGDSLAARAVAALRDVVLLVADEPALARACTAAMLTSEPDVRHLRERIGGWIHRRLAHALGPAAAPGVLGALELAYTGAMVQAGMGHLTYERMADRLTEAAELICGGTA
ncbi:TetR/AcrR family transcriptional regulator [Bailinhaonella thermotolerans]|uniref:TetR/AcrR family transcriptional regulator n=1 Tax=Bailinhaonella thermotolerans TaxID=1070861 RepID=A0A3A4ARG2_9ACTN|nr:TetR/AcrR family transcriptional regulator [Bailinhaonella thermotolerans]RJL31701.1 TetR/AcrR family transcriptional regulator [Bailinhaonella thermotolerans]